MRRIFFVVLIVQISAFNGALIAGDEPKAEDELTTLKRDYADVLALQGTAKGEILTIARILRASPKIAIDQTSASGEYCFNSGQGTMVHFATQPERLERWLKLTGCRRVVFGHTPHRSSTPARYHHSKAINFDGGLSRSHRMYRRGAPLAASVAPLEP